MMEQIGKARISDETFDDFLASENLLAACEEDAIKEIIADERSNPNPLKTHP